MPAARRTASVASAALASAPARSISMRVPVLRCQKATLCARSSPTAISNASMTGNAITDASSRGRHPNTSAGGRSGTTGNPDEKGKCSLKPATQEWIEKAEGDYRTALRERRVRRRPNHDAVCFHAQQCIEKYLKALLPFTLRQAQGERGRALKSLKIFRSC